MAAYSKELKESLITKMLVQNISAAELAEAAALLVLRKTPMRSGGDQDGV